MNLDFNSFNPIAPVRREPSIPLKPSEGESLAESGLTAGKPSQVVASSDRFSSSAKGVSIHTSFGMKPPTNDSSPDTNAAWGAFATTHHTDHKQTSEASIKPSNSKVSNRITLSPAREGDVGSVAGQLVAETSGLGSADSYKISSVSSGLGSLSLA